MPIKSDLDAQVIMLLDDPREFVEVGRDEGLGRS